MQRRAYLSDVSDWEWAFVASHLAQMTEDASQLVYPLRHAEIGPSILTLEAPGD